VAAQWPGSYSEAYGHHDITVEADGTMLAIEIRGVVFSGRDFDDLEPLGTSESTGMFATSHGGLTDYKIGWQMPVQVVSRGTEITAALNCELVLGNPPGHEGARTEDLTISLVQPEAAPVTTTRPYGFFEEALADIQRQLAADTYLKACISCAYSDYSPAGSGLSGSLACFRDNKAAYRAVSGKRDLFRVWETRTEFVRETHLCPEFERRAPHAGYRGGFPEP
jgi:Family of unknown function (DUF6304)